MTENNLMGD